MARRRARGGYRNNPYNRKAYEFTSRRRAALKRAQALSARKKKMQNVKVGIMAAGGLAAVGVGLYLGRNTHVGKSIQRDVAKQVRSFSPQHVGRAQNIARARAAVNPINKETMRMAGAISPADAPRAIPHGPLHIGPHTPGDQITQPKPDPATFKRIDLGRQSEASVQAQRDALAAQAAFAASAEGSVARFTDNSEASLPRELTGEKVQPLRRETAARAVGQNEAAKARSGVPTQGKAGRRDTVDMMIAGSIDTARAAHGVQTPIRTNPRATGPTHIGAGATAAEHDAIWAEYDAQRGLSTTRPGTVPHTTAKAANTTSVPGVGTQHGSTASAIGQSIPGWHGLSKEQKAAKRAFADTAGLKISAAGKISHPASAATKKKAKKAKPPSNPSGKSVSEIHGDKILAKAGYDPVSSSRATGLAPGHGSKAKGWEGMTSAQRSVAQAYAYKFGLFIDPRTGLYKTRKR